MADNPFQLPMTEEELKECERQVLELIKRLQAAEAKKKRPKLKIIKPEPEPKKDD